MNSDFLKNKRVLVCCGAGGVGKTTISAALAIHAARQGRRVLVVTIDPSKRLAESLGISRNAPQPVALSAERLAELEIAPPGQLSAWMLDPQLICDRCVHHLIRNPTEAERLLKNRIYSNVTAMLAGMQEYTAVEALHGFIKDDAYDLVVLDTPPSRNALRFLEAPNRAMAFLDKRIFSLFVPSEGSRIRQMAIYLIERVMDLAFGADTRRDLQVFFQLFSNILSHLNDNQSEMRQFFQEDCVGFLLVTSPEREALNEARYFEAKTRDELHLHLCGYILNRSLAWTLKRPMPGNLPEHSSDALKSAWPKLVQLAEQEHQVAERHFALAQELKSRAGFVAISPVLPGGVSNLETLNHLSHILFSNELK